MRVDWAVVPAYLSCISSCSPWPAGHLEHTAVAKRECRRRGALYGQVEDKVKLAMEVPERMISRPLECEGERWESALLQVLIASAAHGKKSQW